MKYSFQALLDIIKELRSDHGCPWDREQTHESLIPCMKEECQEAVWAIEHQDHDNLKEELGDVLLQVVMHAQIASEEGWFNMDDVIEEVSEKMVRRHPHVFGDVTVETKEEQLALWNEIKRKEKEILNEKKEKMEKKVNISQK